jgi:FMN phosphatase YigB (HAD superfamily)
MKDLHSQGVKFALLSNMGKEHHDYLKIICPEIFDLSEIHFLSYQVGARKPSRVYFKTFIDDYNSWGGSIYIDDRLENLIASKQYAFRAIQFELDKQQSTLDLKKNTDNIKKIIFSHIPNEEIR